MIFGASQLDNSGKKIVKPPHCIFCEKRCTEIFHFKFKGKNICGNCLDEVKELMRVKEVLHKELQVAKREIEKLKIEVEKQSKELEGAKSLPRDFLKLSADILSCARTLKSIDELQKKRRKRKTNDHNSLVLSIHKLFPVVYKKIFHEDFRAVYEVEVNQVVGQGENRGDADIVIKKGRQIVKIIKVETDLPKDSSLRNHRKSSLEKELGIFSMEVGKRNVALITLDWDKKFNEICEDIGVRYLSLQEVGHELRKDQIGQLEEIATQLGI